MATKPREFDPLFCYHIYNRGVEKRDIFLTDGDYSRFLDTVSFYLYDQDVSYAQYNDFGEERKLSYNSLNPKGLEDLRVRLVAYCLMPNHFHFVLKLNQPDGITKFVSDISNSHTKYFNLKNERTGRLFQGTFKSKEIDNEPSLLQLIRYIHLNPVESKRTNPTGTIRPEDYVWSSHREWLKVLDPKGLELVHREEVARWVDYMGGVNEYKGFVESKMPGYFGIGVEDLVIEEVGPDSRP